MLSRSEPAAGVPACQAYPAVNGAGKLMATNDPTYLHLNPITILRVLLIVISVLVITGTIANVIIYHVAASPEDKLAKLMHRFDLGHEPSIPAWYSSLALVVCSGLLAVIAVVKMRRKQPYVAHWFGLTAMFLLMGLDEAIMIHEMTDDILHRRLNTSGFLYFAWVIPGMVVVLAVGVTFWNFLRHLDARTRWFFVLSGTVFVSGAIGMELIAGMIFTVGAGVESLAHTASQAVEEALEMLGVVLFMYALLEFIGRDIGPIVIDTGAPRGNVTARPKVDV